MWRYRRICYLKSKYLVQNLSHSVLLYKTLFCVIIFFMEEFEPFPLAQTADKLTAAEYVAREEALQALIAEAVEAHDANRLGIYQEALSELDSDNPGKGTRHSIDECPEIIPIERLTPEQARTVDLSRNPVKRLGQLAHYGSAFNMRQVGWSPLPMYMTRGDLIRAAESRRHAEQIMGLS